jgi:IS4 transposase
MPHRNIILHEILRLVPWARFKALVEEQGADKHVRTLSSKTQFVTLLYAQLAGLTGLRETVDALNSHARHLYHLGARRVARSTLADANRLRPSAVFEQMFFALVRQSGRKTRRHLEGLTLLIDSTSLRLNQYSANWAKFSTDVCGAKAHIIYDPDSDRPVYAAVTPARVNDITAAQDMPIVAGATYVFDLGYYDFSWWARMDAAKCRIVTRLKKNTPLTVTRERLIEPGRPILSDRIGTLPARQAANRRNPVQAEVREVRVRIDTGIVLRILTNDLDASAQEIADLYQRRWAIELYFRWIKQVLRIRRFMGVSENAVRIQLFVALIAFLLIRIAHAGQSAVTSMVRFVRLLRGNLMHKRTIGAIVTEFITPQSRPRKPAERSADTTQKPTLTRLFGNVFGGAGCLDF